MNSAGDQNSLGRSGSESWPSTGRVSLGLQVWGGPGFPWGLVGPLLKRQVGPSCIYPHVHMPLFSAPIPTVLTWGLIDLLLTSPES